MKKFSAVLFVLILGFVACKTAKYKDLDKGIYADIQTAKGDILVQLRPDKAPVTVASFVSLAEGNNPYVDDKYKGKPFYDGLTFHRVVSKATGAKNDFVIQGGDPLGTGEGGPGYQFKNEISDLKHIKGALSMAREPKPDTNGSQFFITLADTFFLDGQYSVFGNTIKGFEVVQKIRKGDKINKINIIRVGREAKKFDAVKVFSNYMAEKEKTMKEVAEKKKKLAADFAAKKKEAKTDESGLGRYIIKEGTGRKPKAGETVQVYYTGYLSDGTKFDSDRGRPLIFAVNKGEVISGWDKGIMNMKEGERAIFFIPPHLGYGERGAGGVIPPNADLIFEVKLAKIGK